jgi:uridylate kinase
MFDRRYNRVLLKISGEALKGNSDSKSQDHDAINRIVDDILEVDQEGIQVCLVVGGGNFYRGRTRIELGIERAAADYIGMLATIMNALTLQEVLISKGVNAKVLSSIPVESICETYSRNKALNYMEQGAVVIFAGGTGNPFVSTDTLAVYRALEMRCDALFKGTQFPGVYSEDPKKNKNAKKYNSLSYNEMIEKKLEVMDLPAVLVAHEQNLPIVVFSILKKGEFNKVVYDDGNFTIIN